MGIAYEFSHTSTWISVFIMYYFILSFGYSFGLWAKRTLWPDPFFP